MAVRLRRIWARLRACVARSSGDDDLREEIGDHLGLLQRRFEAQGLSPDEAKRAAHGAFGGVEQLREQLHDQQSFPWFDALRQDVRYAIRTIVRTPVVSLAVIVTFALGIGANAAIFSLVNSVLLTPLPYTSADRIVVVEPVGFKYPGKTDIWFPAGLLPEAPRGGHNYLVVGRLKPDARVEEAGTEMRGIADRLEQQYPSSNRNKTVVLTPLREKLTGGARTTLWLLLGTVAGVLLIACVNVANLQLVRASARGREMAVRSAMGAGPGRVVRQVLTESLLLGGVGCLAGLAAGWLTLKAFVAIAPPDTPRLNEVHIDQRVLLFTLGLTALCSLLFGLGPARRVARLELSDALKQQPGKGVRSGVGSRTRSALVMAEVALSFALLVAAGLLLRSIVEL